MASFIKKHMKKFLFEFILQLKFLCLIYYFISVIFVIGFPIRFPILRFNLVNLDFKDSFPFVRSMVWAFRSLDQVSNFIALIFN